VREDRENLKGVARGVEMHFEVEAKKEESEERVAGTRKRGLRINSCGGMSLGYSL